MYLYKHNSKKYKFVRRLRIKLSKMLRKFSLSLNKETLLYEKDFINEFNDNININHYNNIDNNFNNNSNDNSNE